MSKKWILKDIEIDKDKVNNIQEKYNIGRLAAEILVRKNLSKDEIEIFLSPKRNNFYDPFMMPDMEKAVDRISKAIENKEKMLVYGDYDADGITSSSILIRFFKSMGVEVGVYIPNRISEGYGLNNEALKKIAADGVNLIITVDTGITAINQVEFARELGMDVIVTDHHEPGDEIPNAVAVVDCKRKDNKYPFRELAGCGVAFKLTQAISRKLEINEEESLKLLDLACVGTISDIVPLIDENRVIAKLGLLLIKQTRVIGLREIIKNIGYKEINTTTIAFGVSPRINACGRMGHQEVALELFLTEDPIVARELAKEVEDYNKKRQDIEKDIYNSALAMIDENDENKAIVLSGDGWHHGIIGIVSSKITEKFYKPSILVCNEGEDARGSGRSVDGFDLHEALLECKDNLVNYGGHSMAVGLSLKTENFDAFKKAFEKYTNEKISEEMLVPKLEIDEEISTKDISIKDVNDLKLLEPFGEGNSEPVILYKNLKINAIRTLSEGKHLKLNLQDEKADIDAIGFGLGELASLYQIGDKIDIVGNIQINKFNNIEKVQVLLKDLRKTVE